MPVLQVPTFKIPLPPVAYQRQLRPGERSRYSVVSDWKGSQGQAHYEYEMAFQTEKPSVKKIELQTSAVLEKLHATYDGVEKSSGKFGVVPFLLAKSGPPKGLSAGSSVNAFALPLLAFSVPDSLGEKDGTFTFSSFPIEQVGSVSGEGHLVSVGRKAIEFEMEFRIGEGADAPKITCRSSFRPFSGRLLRAEGSYIGPDGTLTFKIESR